MLAYKQNEQWAEWKGEPRPQDGAGAWELPLNAETRSDYPDQRLQSFGLYRVQLATIPEGKVMLTQSLVDNAGMPKQVVTLGNPPADPAVDPLTQSLTKRQVNAALIIGAGIMSPDDFARTALEAISDPQERALALNDWETAPYFDRSHPLFTNPAVIATAEMTSSQIDQLWVLGWQQPR